MRSRRAPMTRRRSPACSATSNADPRNRMPSLPRISIVLPVYGVPEYLDACLDSVLGQAPPDIEVIAVDDASPDACGQILDARATADPRLRVTHLARNAGPGNARNVGLSHATGDYVWFADADDLLADGALAEITARLALDRPDVLLVDYQDYYAGGATARSHGAALLRGAPAGTFALAAQPALIDLTMTSWSKVIRRGFLAEIGLGFPPASMRTCPCRAPCCSAPAASARLPGSAIATEGPGASPSWSPRATGISTSSPLTSSSSTCCRPLPSGLARRSPRPSGLPSSGGPSGTTPPSWAPAASASAQPGSAAAWCPAAPARRSSSGCTRTSAAGARRATGTRQAPAG